MAEDLLAANAQGHVPLGMMVAAGEEKKLFAPFLWRGRFAEAEKLHAALAHYHALHKIDFEEFRAAYQQFLLSESKGGNKIRILSLPKTGRG